ncbi:MAG: hypothetical protein J6T77_06935, partial [Clostridia bacterium]|nr:hypothetical protein [Clostridia bacterium]
MIKNQKLAREDSEAMLDLIFEARGCELGSIFQVGKRTAGTTANEMFIQLLNSKGAQQFTSLYDKYKNSFETDTEDLTGRVLSTCEKLPEKEKVKEVCESFVGELDQVPPMYSALKQN